ncbi:MAG: CooT family nickel-binding protein, partial [Desulfotignum sp.]
MSLWHPICLLYDVMQGDSDMCEANAYFTENGTQTLIMEAVDKVEPDEDGIRLVSIFGE